MTSEGYFVKNDAKYLEKLHDLHNGLPLLPGRMKIEKVKKLPANLHSKIENVIHKRKLKQVLNH